MAVSVREALTNTGSGAATSVTTGAGTAAGDVLVCFHATDFYAAASMSQPTQPSGVGAWTTQATADLGTNDTHVKCYTATVTSGGAKTISVSPVTDEEVHIGLYVIANPGTIADGSAQTNLVSTVNNNFTLPSITTTGSDDVYLGCVVTGGSAISTFGTPTGMTAGGQTNNFISLGLFYQTLSSSGATGTKSGSNTGSRTSANIAIAISSAATAASSAPLIVYSPGRIAPSGLWTPFIGDTTTGTAAAAGAASGTGQAFDAVAATQNSAFDPAPVYAPPPGRIAPAGEWAPPPLLGDTTTIPNSIPTAGNAAGSGQAYDTTTGLQNSAYEPALPFTPPPGRLAPAGQWNLFLGDTTTAPALNVSAGVASGIGQAFDAAITISPAAGNASGTGSAGNAADSIAGTAGNASGTGSAGDPAPSILPSAGNASGTGAAGAATGAIATNAGNATGTGTAAAPTPNVAPNAGNAAAAGSAFDATTNIAIGGTGAATGTGTAFDTLNVPHDPAPLFTPPPGRLSPGGRWSPFIGNVQAATDATPSAGNAAGTGQAFDATISVATAAGNASGTGSAGTAADSVSGTAGAATGTGTSGAPVPNVGAQAGNAAGTGAAYQPTVTVPGATNADGGLASGTGSAFQAIIVISPRAALAAGAGSAYDTTIARASSALAGLASGTGQAFNTTNGVPVVHYPLHTGSVTDLAGRDHAGTVTDLSAKNYTGTVSDVTTRYRADTPART